MKPRTKRRTSYVPPPAMPCCLCADPIGDRPARWHRPSRRYGHASCIRARQRQAEASAVARAANEARAAELAAGAVESPETAAIRRLMREVTAPVTR